MKVKVFTSFSPEETEKHIEAVLMNNGKIHHINSLYVGYEDPLFVVISIFPEKEEGGK